MNINGLNQREKILGIITASFILAVLFSIGILEPQIKKHDSLRKKLNDLQVRYTKMQTDLLMQDRIKRSYDQMQHLIEDAETEQQQISVFTGELSDLFSSKAKSVKFLPSLKEKHYSKLSIKADMVVNIQYFLQLIEHIRKLNKPIQIESFELRAQEATDLVHVSLVITKIVKSGKV